MELKATSPAQYSVSPSSQIIPDQHHGDAAGQADDDQTHHVLRVVPQKHNGQREHKDRADDPVLDQGEGQDFEVLEDLGQFLVAHLGQRRIHHQDEADGDGNGGRPHLKTGQPCGEARA